MWWLNTSVDIRWSEIHRRQRLPAVMFFRLFSRIVLVWLCFSANCTYAIPSLARSFDGVEIVEPKTEPGVIHRLSSWHHRTRDDHIEPLSTQDESPLTHESGSRPGFRDNEQKERVPSTEETSPSLDDRADIQTNRKSDPSLYHLGTHIHEDNSQTGGRDSSADSASTDLNVENRNEVRIHEASLSNPANSDSFEHHLGSGNTLQERRGVKVLMTVSVIWDRIRDGLRSPDHVKPREGVAATEKETSLPLVTADGKCDPKRLALGSAIVTPEKSESKEKKKIAVMRLLRPVIRFLNMLKNSRGHTENIPYAKLAARLQRLHRHSQLWNAFDQATRQPLTIIGPLPESPELNINFMRPRQLTSDGLGDQEKEWRSTLKPTSVTNPQDLTPPKANLDVKHGLGLSIATPTKKRKKNVVYRTIETTKNLSRKLKIAFASLSKRNPIKSKQLKMTWKAMKEQVEKFQRWIKHFFDAIKRPIWQNSAGA